MNVQDLRAAITALASEPHEYRTVVLDSIDATEPMIWKDVCATQSWASIEAPGYGKGYVAADNWWRLDILSGLEYLRRERGMMVVLLAHSTIETVNDPRTASPYTSYQLRLHKRARGLVQDWCRRHRLLGARSAREGMDDAGFGKKRARADGGSQRWLQGGKGSAVVRCKKTDMACRPRCRCRPISGYGGARLVFPAAVGAGRTATPNEREGGSA